MAVTEAAICKHCNRTRIEGHHYDGRCVHGGRTWEEKIEQQQCDAYFLEGPTKAMLIDRQTLQPRAEFPRIFTNGAPISSSTFPTTLFECPSCPAMSFDRETLPHHVHTHTWAGNGIPEWHRQEWNPCGGCGEYKWDGEKCRYCWRETEAKKLGPLPEGAREKLDQILRRSKELHAEADAMYNDARGHYEQQMYQAAHALEAYFGHKYEIRRVTE